MLQLLVILFAIGASAAFAQSVTSEAQLDSSQILVDQQVMVVSDLTNGQDRDQKFAYIVQIKNEDEVVISLSWLTGSLGPRQTFSPAISWIPTQPGEYIIEIFVWEGIDNAEAISPPQYLAIQAVTEKASG